ncbi:MAG: MBL fold metallo-hydrolase [Candidatus Thorarchaeota archaeon]|nr:MBL fold metallo-hydrolase [Candidatus Thorarchaeota archaeon]
MALEKVSGRVYADTTGANGGNHGVVVLKDEIVAVDSGMYHPRTAAMKAKLDADFGLPILKLLYTHYHSDHVFGAQAFEQATKISSKSMGEICEQLMEKEWTREAILEYASEIKDTRPEYWAAVQTLEICLPNIIFEYEIIMGTERDIAFRHVGGHTAGSSIVIVEPEHVIFTGDLIFHHSFPYAGDPTCNPELWIDALEGILASNFDEVIPGHGVLCGNTGVKEQLDFLLEFKSRITKCLSEGLDEEEFIQEGMVPQYFVEGAEHRIESSVSKWFEFYRQA